MTGRIHKAQTCGIVVTGQTIASCDPSCYCLSKTMMDPLCLLQHLSATDEAVAQPLTVAYSLQMVLLAVAVDCLLYWAGLKVPVPRAALTRTAVTTRWAVVASRVWGAQLA